MTNPSTESKATIQINGVTLPILSDDPTTWYNSSLVTVNQISESGLQLLLQTSHKMQRLVQSRNEKKTMMKKKTKNSESKKKNDGDDDCILQSLENFVIGTIFYEASTRTSCSFQGATLQLRGNYIHVDGIGNTSTAKKGETLYDTIRCIQCYTDAVVLRHPSTGSIYNVIQQQQQQQQQQQSGKIATNDSGSASTKPIINAGDGIGEHPTQALLDVYTIYTEFVVNRCNNQIPETLVVVVLGDLKHGRTVHSLVKLLTSTTHNILYTKQLIIRCCAPNDSLQLPPDVIDGSTPSQTRNVSVRMEIYTDPMLACMNANVLYVTRIQRERFLNDTEYDAVRGSYVVNMQFLNTVSLLSHNKSNDKMIVLHPLPRVDEISTDIDHDERTVYFQQMEYGMYVRMAILYLILHHHNTEEVETINE